jgi:hypothetical protein
MLTIRGKKFMIVGIARPPLGAYASDIYVRLGLLQTLSGREGRVNVLRARARSASEVKSIADGIERAVTGSRVTTARDLADRVTGSLDDTKGRPTSSAPRELRTLKAIGWHKRLVVRLPTSRPAISTPRQDAAFSACSAKSPTSTGGRSCSSPTTARSPNRHPCSCACTTAGSIACERKQRRKDREDRQAREPDRVCPPRPRDVSAGHHAWPGRQSLVHRGLCRGAPGLRERSAQNRSHHS